MATPTPATDDGWPPVTYRQRVTDGYSEWSVKLARPASRIETVIDPDGRVLLPWEYALEPFYGRRAGDRSPRLWFRQFRATRGLTILFEAAD